MICKKHFYISNALAPECLYCQIERLKAELHRIKFEQTAALLKPITGGGSGETGSI
jgi:hypothetical protein